MKTACLTVFYPGMEPFLEEYIESVIRQTDNDFELVIVNDNYITDSTVLRKLNVPYHMIESAASPQENRLEGLQFCYRKDYDLIICSDSDEMMGEDRVGKIKTFFETHPDEKIAFNNAVYENGGKYFDLYYKDVLVIEDIIDFNVLGYGAMNVRKEIIPFILQHENENAEVFDWWLASVYLLNHKKVTFLPEVHNLYRRHENNFVGPVVDITEAGLRQGLRVKKNLYTELKQYCILKNYDKYAELYRVKAEEVEKTEKFIREDSFSRYMELVKRFWQNAEKLYWWQDAITVTNLTG